MTSADCQLKVWRLSEGRFNPLAETELVGLWKRFDIDMAHFYNKWLNTLSDLLLYVSMYDLLQSLLSSYFSCKQIVFEGVKGTAGVVALDDIEYTIGINCANKVTDPIKRMSRTPRFLFKLLQTVLEVFNVSAQCACSDSVLRNLKSSSHC